METARNVIARVKSGLKLHYGDSELSDRAILDELRSTASLYIRRETNLRKLMASPNIFTPIPCLEMEEVPLAECCSYHSACTIARSKVKIPKIGDNIFGLVIQGVTGIEKGGVRNVKFNYCIPERYTNLLELRIKRKNFFWIYDGYLYITDPDIATVSLSAYFEEDVPPELLKCNADATDCPINPYDVEFKCPGYLIAAVVTTVRENIKKEYKSSIQDVSNDNLDEGK